MSRLIWSGALVPTNEPVDDMVYDIFTPHLRVAKTQAIAKSENDFTEIPDRKALRLMSRSSVLLSALLMRAKDVVAELNQKDPFRVATYCAIENGSESYACIQSMLDVEKEDFAEKYKRSRSPKQYLKQLPNLAPAQAGIFLGLVGPLNVFHHSRRAGRHALEQMQADLNAGRIDAGIVCSAMSFEDALATYRCREEIGPEKILREGAGALIFVKDERDCLAEPTSAANIPTSDPYHYGIATDIIHLSQDRKTT